MTVPMLLARILGWRRVLGNAVVLVLAGALVSFVISFVARSALDRAFFEAGLSYSSRAVVPTAAPSDGLVLSFSSAAGVALAARDLPGGGVAYVRSAEVTLSVYDGSKAEMVRELLARTLTGGRVGTAGVVLDQATAVKMGADIGGTIVLVSDDLTTSCSVTVDGLTRPFRPLDGSDGSGLVMVPTGLCNSVLAAHLQEHPPVRYRFADPGRGTPQFATVLSSIESSEITQPATLAILAVALAVWLLATRRTGVHVSSILSTSGLTLLRQGVGPRILRTTCVVMVWCLCLIGAVLASSAARFGLDLLASVYVQPVFVGAVAALLSVVALPLTLIQFRGWPLSTEVAARRGDG